MLGITAPQLAIKPAGKKAVANQMAKILTTAIVADIRNKLNGSVFSKNRYGGYVRTKVTLVNPQTTAQQAARNNLSTRSQAWRGLTEEQRQSWIDGAANFPFTDIFGNTKILSGQTLFVKLNTNLVNVGVAPLVTCPSPVAMPAIESLTLTAVEATTLSLAFAPSPVPPDFAMQIFATPNITPGRTYVKNRFRYVTMVDAAATTPANILTPWEDLFGIPTAGSKIFVRAVMVSKITGQMGIPLQTNTIVTA